jgi:hypothetical protein
MMATMDFDLAAIPREFPQFGNPSGVVRTMPSLTDLHANTNRS